MTDREFIKLNTSIQTASNSSTIQEQEDGTIPACIELRLPDSLFNAQTGNKKIDSVSMLTTKLRLSMINAPIAQIPLDPDLTKKYYKKVTPCKLDVYPYVVDENGEIKPTPPSSELAFPSYKQHLINFKIKVCMSLTPEQYFTDPKYDFTYVANDITNLQDYYPQTNIFFEVLKNNDLLGNHLMNMVVPESYEMFNHIENDTVFVKNIATLQQTWNDALENAIMYASTSVTQDIELIFIEKSIINPSLNPQPNQNITVHISDFEIDVCYWKYNITNTQVSRPMIQHACKPSFIFDESAMTMSYDTVAFKDTIPIYWANSFIDTYSTPLVESMDKYRADILNIPPPKRVYKNAIHTEGQSLTSLNYDYTLSYPQNPKVFNIVANEATRDNFPFLPWIQVTPEQYKKYQKQITLSKTYYEIEKTETGREIIRPYITDNGSSVLTAAVVGINRNNHYEYTAGSSTSTSRQLEVPEYISTLLNQNYPIIRTDSIIRYAMAIDFWFPIDDPEYMRSGSLIDVKPSSRFNQMLILPVPLEGYHDVQSIQVISPNQEGSITPISKTYPTHTQDVIYTQNLLEPSRTLIHENIEPQTETKDEIISVYNDNLMFYHYGEVTDEWEQGLPKSGTWIEQTFPQGTGSETAFEQRVYKAIQHLPPWLPEMEQEAPDDIRIINNRRCKRGCLIWVILNTSNEGGYPIRLYLAASMEENCQQRRTTTKETQTTTKTYYVIERITENVQDGSILPNFLESDDESFYILNGAAAEMSIGPQEVIQTSASGYHIQETATSTPSSRTKTTDTTANYIDPTTNEYYLREKAEHVGRLRVVPDPPTPPPTGVYVSAFYTMEQTSTQKNYTDVDIINTDNYPEYTLNPKEETVSYSSWQQGDPVVTTNAFDSSDPYYESLIGRTEETSSSSSSEVISTEELDAPMRVFYLVCDPTTGEYIRNEAQRIQYGNQFAYIPTVAPFYTSSESSGGTTTYRDWYLLESREKNYFTYPTTKVYTTVERETNTETVTVRVVTAQPGYQYDGNMRLTWQWKNIPTVIMSPIQSFVLLLQGMNVSQEIHPINISQPGAASLNSVVPIVENYYSLATTLRDLHDELVVVKDTYTDSAFYKLDTTSGQQRTVTLTMKYITKDGRLHQLFIPKDGVFAIQLTFGINYYLV